MNAADVVALPYAETFNSGAALLALSFNRPIVAPASGSFPKTAGSRGSAPLHLTDVGARKVEKALGGIDLYSEEHVATTLTIAASARLRRSSSHSGK